MPELLAPLYNAPDATGHFGRFGGAFVPETIVQVLAELSREYDRGPS